MWVGGGGWLNPFPFSQSGHAVWACGVVLEALGPLVSGLYPSGSCPAPGFDTFPHLGTELLVWLLPVQERPGGNATP